MNKTTQLFVRACKADSRGKRIRSVYRRFYLNKDQVDAHLVNILCGICTEYKLIDPMKLLEELQPSHDWKYEGCNWYQRVVRILSSHIRLAHRDCFPGLTPPIYFRRKEAA